MDTVVHMLWVQGDEGSGFPSDRNPISFESFSSSYIDTPCVLVQESSAL